MSQNIYVGNLNYDTTEDMLRNLFSEYGQVDSVKVITDRYTGRSRGFGFVEMSTEDEAQAAITALNGKLVDNRELRVDKAKPRRERGSDRGQSGRGRPRW